MASVTASDGTSTVEVSGVVELERDILEGIAPRVVDRFESTAHDIVSRALPDWPVRTGKSRDGFRVRTRLHLDDIETKVFNSQRYAYKVKYSWYTKEELQASGKTEKQAQYLKKKHGEGAPSAGVIGRHPWTLLVRSPARKAEAALADELADDLHRLADGEG